SLGAQTISANDTTSLGIVGTSNVITVSTTASQLAVSAPANVTAGTPFVVTVTAEDSTGHLAAGYTGTVHFTSTDPQAVLPADSTLTNGVGSFLVTLKTVQGSPWTITAKDTVQSSITGTSGNIAVAPGAASYFTVVAPATAITGVPASVTI